MCGCKEGACMFHRVIDSCSFGRQTLRIDKPLIIVDPARKLETGEKSPEIEPENLTEIARKTRTALAYTWESRFMERYALHKYVEKGERSGMIDEVRCSTLLWCVMCLLFISFLGLSCLCAMCRSLYLSC